VTRVLVTGGAGFIGSHTVDGLLARGLTVRVLDALRPPVHRDGIWPDYLPADVERVHGDVTDSEVLRRSLDDVQIVYHLAAYQDYLPDFSRFFKTNAVSTALLYELIVNEQRQVELVVVASSQAVYGEGKYRCQACGVVYPDQRDEPQLRRGEWEIRCPTCRGELAVEWTDEAVVHPHNSYAMSKRAQEELALSLGRRYGIPTVALRYSIVQGPRQSFRNAYSGALRSFAVRVLHGRPPVVYEDGGQQRDYVWIGDVVAANLLPLAHDGMAYAAYNVGGNRTLTVRELARLVIAESGADVEPVLPGTYRLGDTRHIRSDVRRLRAFGWSPREAQDRVVRAYLAWAREQSDLADTYAEAETQMRAAGVLRDALPTAP
jgi:dTDP-L-rhamnose 4-epimerase